MRRLHVHHETVYRYSEPVRFNEHRLALRPRDSHDIRLLDTRLVLSPAGNVRWSYDVFGNSIAIATFDEMASELRITSELLLEHHGVAGVSLPVASYAEHLPFAYSSEEAPELSRTCERQYPDAEHRVDTFARRFVAAGASTLAVLENLTRNIRAEFRYEPRDTFGTREPVETLARGSGSCRDFAVLLAESVRSLGLAARFVSGYFHDMNADGSMAAATHAWTEVYVPGPGWIELDPTNGLVGSDRLVRVTVARTPAGAVPIAGSFVGPGGVFLGMAIDVRVSEVPCDFQLQ